MESESRPNDGDPVPKARGFGLATATFVVVSSMVGTGVLTTSGYTVYFVGSNQLMLVLWILGGVAALCGALTLCELSAALPRSGGDYVFLYEAYGSLAAFLTGWVSFLIGFGGPIAASAFASAKYLLIPFRLEGTTANLAQLSVATLAILVFSVVHILGRVHTVRVQAVITVLKLGILGLLAGVGLAAGAGRWGNLDDRPPLRYDLRLMPSASDASAIPAEGQDLVVLADVKEVLHVRVFDSDGNKVVDTDEQKLAGQSQQIEDLRNQLRDVWPPHELTRQEESVLVNAVTSMVGHSPLLSIPVLISMMSALVYISYAYTGWNAASYLAGEVERPQQEMPRAILLGTGLVLLLYLSLNCVYALALPAAEVRRIVEDPSNRQGVDAVAPIAQLAVERLLGVKLSDPLSVAIGLTLLASLSAYILTGPRVAYAMAQTGQFPAIAGRLSSRNGTPVIATGLQSAWSLVLLWTGSFEMILLYSGVGLALFSMITVSAVYVLRWRRPDLPRPFRTPGYPVVPAIYLALTGLLVAAVFWERPLVSFLSLLSILAGIPLYGLWLWLSPRSERPV